MELFRYKDHNITLATKGIFNCQLLASIRCHVERGKKFELGGREELSSLKKNIWIKNTLHAIWDDIYTIGGVLVAQKNGMCSL
jgi:hypothetical protein